MRWLTLGALAVASPLAAQPVDEEVLVRALFAELNPISIAEGVEYCGYVGFDIEGDLIFSEPTRGDESSCLSSDPAEIEVITASYHTHGQFLTDYANELPSGEDMEGDEAEGIDGWVATPGGRLWYIDTDLMETFQVCGIGCLPTDPEFIAGDFGPIAERYSYDALVRKLDEE